MATKTLFNGFTTTQGPKIRKLHDIDLAIQDLRNHFYTKKGERIMDPEFGSIIWGLMFEPWDDTVEAAVKDDCTDIVSKDPRWALEEISTYSNQNALSVQIKVKYQPTDKVEVLALEFDRELSEDL